MKNIFAVLILLTTIIACSEEHTHKSWKLDTDPVIEGVPARKYWDQYTNIEKKCGDGLEIKFLETKLQVVRANYRDTYLASLSLVLNRDQTYRAHYLEESEDVGNDIQNIVTGTWTLNANGDVVLENLGKLSAERYGKFRFVYDKTAGVRALDNALQLKPGTMDCDTLQRR